MDSWLKAAREQAAKLGEDIQKQAILLAEDGQKGKRELTFREGPLGFELNGIHVAFVEASGQAEHLGVRPGDKLISIAGYVIPENPKEESVKRWLDEMIRPGRLTFFSEPEADGSPSPAVIFPKESDTADSGLLSFQENGWQDDLSFPDVEDKDSPASELPQALMGEARLRAELYAARNEARSLERELEDSKAQCQELRHFAAEAEPSTVVDERVQRLSDQLQNARKDAEETRKKCRQLQVQLDSMGLRYEELRKESVRNEERAMEAMEGREEVLEEEVARLRSTITELKTEQHTSIRAVEMQLRESQDHIEELEKRLAHSAQEKIEMEGLIKDAVARGMTAETQADVARSQLCKLEACHAAEVSSLQARYDRQMGELLNRIDELETEKAKAEPPPKPEENTPVSPVEEDVEKEPEVPGLAAGSFDTVEDVRELQARIHVLEMQCTTLQRKLKARPIVYQTPRAARRVPKPGGGLVGVLRDIVEELLRNFTERLLKRDAFLWVFYGHLCVLYVIAASCYAQTGVGSATVDVDLHAKALRGSR